MLPVTQFVLLAHAVRGAAALSSECKNCLLTGWSSETAILFRIQFIGCRLHCIAVVRPFGCRTLTPTRLGRGVAAIASPAIGAILAVIVLRPHVGFLM